MPPSIAAAPGKATARVRHATQAPLGRGECLGSTSDLKRFQSVPRRRLQKEVQLQTAISSVAEAEFSSGHGVDGSASPSSRKNVSLRLPRMPTTPSAVNQAPGKDHDKTVIVDVKAQQVASEELEDLRAQNEILKKSLATLKASVVESMKGNKAQFVGNGFFKQKGKDGHSGKQSQMGLPMANLLSSEDHVEEQLEELQQELRQRREELRQALAERDAAIQKAHKCETETQAMQHANKDLQAEVTRLASQVEEANDLQGKAEAALVQLKGQVKSLQVQLEDMRKDGSSTLARLTGAEARNAELEQEVTKLQEYYTSTLAEARKAEADVVRMLEQTSRQEQQLAQMRIQGRGICEKVLTRCLDMKSQMLQDCFHSWATASAVHRAHRLSEQASEWQDKATCATRELEQLQQQHGSELDEVRHAADEAASKAAQYAAKEREAMHEAERLRLGMSQLEGQMKTLSEEAQEARSSSKATSLQLDALRTSSDEGKAAIAKMREMSEQLQKLQDAQAESSSRLSAASDREAALCRELETAKKTEALAKQQRDDARKRSIEVENQRKAAVKELEALRAGSARAEDDLALMQRRAEEAEAKVKQLQASAIQLEQAAAKLEAQNRLVEERCQAGKDAAASKDVELSQVGDKLAYLSKDNTSLTSEVDRLKSALAEAKCDARASAERARILGEEHKSLERALEEAKAGRRDALRHAEEVEAGPARFLAEARQALVDARQNIRIMVTAPKVSVNICNNEFGLHTPFPFKAIQDAVRDEVMPKFARVFSVSEQSHDAEIRKGVQDMVEQLALTLQTKVHELMPKAEGTCNWEGFGAKCGTLSGSISAAQFRKG